jgi:hypothetical protein
MEQQVAWGAGKPGDEDLLLSMQSDTDAYYGRMSKARDFSRRAVDSAVRADSKETAGSWQVNAALREAELGNAAAAKQGVAAALALSPGRDVKMAAALTLARIGEVQRARALAGELEKSYPTNTLLKLYWLPTINAAIEISKGNSSQAIADLEPAAPYELGQAGTSINYLYPAYVRGQAYLLAHNGIAAAAEFQKLLDHRGIVLNFVTGSLAHLQIGRAYAMQGEPESESRLPRLPHTLERRRPRRPHPEASQDRVREAAMELLFSWFLIKRCAFQLSHSSWSSSVFSFLHRVAFTGLFLLVNLVAAVTSCRCRLLRLSWSSWLSPFAFISLAVV